MILYHGSNLIIPRPRLVPQNRYLDFGYGFYTTTNRAQAISFADKVTRRRREGTPSVSIYELEEAAFSTCQVLRFSDADVSWLDYVSDNRSGAYTGPQHDIIFGPVADDDVYTTLTLYTSGVFTKEQTLEALKIKKLFDQLVLASEKSLSYLHFICSVPQEELL